MPMCNPPHPGELLREDVLPALGLTSIALARHLDFLENAVLDVLAGHSSISADLALRLELAGLGSARHWLAMQMAYDLWQAQQRDRPTISPLYP
ncbi:HigA family addiction module antitoxin [Pseudomonas aeruginosa]|uniref:HigA family addiction module antitoxin n=1 Tax=Pseudomonas aeruginosa TaxID=287 RepID=UPI0026E9DBE5|nr:HigA family addiction module antitoxin [Pseudomonas aeruginosa]